MISNKEILEFREKGIVVVRAKWIGGEHSSYSKEHHDILLKLKEDKSILVKKYGDQIGNSKMQYNDTVEFLKHWESPWIKWSY